jgi:hypothetical protein
MMEWNSYGKRQWAMAMPSRRCKYAILSALRREPDFSSLTALSALNPQESRDFLRWLDRSGLALSFLNRLQVHEAIALIPPDLHLALRRRLDRNVERVRDMLGEFHRLMAAFREHGVFVATLKGFTLVPDFCEDISLRHQTDFDFFIAPESVELAAAALDSRGYLSLRLSKTGESSFTTPPRHVPSRRDDLYLPQHHRQVELHTSVWEDCPWLTVDVPCDFLRNSQPVSVHSVQCFGLALEDKFLVHVLHLFRHSFRCSWIRLSWLLEIVRCMDIHRHDTLLWRRVITRAGEERVMKGIFAFVLDLANRLFACCAPTPLLSWSSEAVSRPTHAWLDNFSLDWAISDWPGNLSNLLISGEFISDRKCRLQFLRSRLLPKSKPLLLGGIVAADGTSPWKMKSARLEYVAHRSAAHVRELIRLSWLRLRWRKALKLQRANVISVEY